MLVGGQAVNFWSEYYVERVPGLRPYAPFTSRDVDFLGSPALVMECAAILGCEPRLEDPYAAGPSVGLLFFRDEDGDTHGIDVLRYLQGVESKRVEETSIPVDVLDEDGEIVTQIRVMSPILCLESRVHNVVDLPGDYDTPHGLWQLQASILCSEAFLSDLLDDGRTREALSSIKRIFALCYHDLSGRKLFAQKRIDPFAIVNADARLPEMFNTTELPKLRGRLAARRESFEK